MKPLVRFTLAQRVFYNLMFVLLIVAGAFAFFELPVERYPKVQFGKVIISAYFPGASPSDVEALVTRKIEDALEDLEHVEFIRSSSYQERCSLMVKFLDDTDYDSLYKDLRFKVLGILDELPDEVEPPVFNMIETADWLPVVNLNLVGDRENRALSLMAEEMKIPLRQIPGVMEVKLQGEYVREFHVFLDPAKMTALGVTFDDAAGAISSANLSIPAGDFKDGAGEVMVVVDERFRTREQVVSTVIRSDLDGSLVTIGDVVSEAGLSYRDPIVISTVNGKDCVTLQILKTEDGNALDIADKVQDIVENFRPSLARQGVEIVPTQDSTVYINESINTLGWNMLVGITLVSVIIWYFMGLRNAGLATVGIPFSFLVTMLIMHITGNSLNEITLFSFVLVSGIIVDDAILVLENIFRHVQEGSKLKDSVINGTSEVMLPVVAATSTTVAAFLPMLIMTGSTGEFFALVPKAVSFAIAASLVECLFMLPLHYLDFGPKPKAPDSSAENHKDNAVLRFFRAVTHKVTRITFKFRVTSILAVVAVFAICLVILGVSASGRIPIIKIKFFPDDYHLYYAVLEGPKSATSGEISEKLKKMSRFVMKDGPGMAESAAAFAGFYITEDYQNVYGHNLGMVMVTLPSKKDQEFDDAMKHLEHMRERLKKEFEGNGFTVLVRAEKDAPPSGKDVNVRVMGPDFSSVSALSQEVLDFMRNDPKIGPHLVELQDDSGRPGPVFRFRVRQDKTREYGLEPAQVARLAASVLDGRFVGKFRVADEEVDLKLRVEHAFLKNPGDALDIPLVEHPSGPVRLGDVCEVQAYEEPGQINRYQGE
ncbi:MAG: efflux RND transporter permease subunit, partial [Thermodesulfobacteriota bacterium]|nr:efflux RND transporter permease subunit [Thermodesulfobacteriota bacterium]